MQLTSADSHQVWYAPGVINQALLAAPQKGTLSVVALQPAQEQKGGRVDSLLLVPNHEMDCRSLDFIVAKTPSLMLKYESDRRVLFFAPADKEKHLSVFDDVIVGQMVGRL